MNKPYRPSGGLEGAAFMAAYCVHCKHEQKYQETGNPEDGCKILLATFAYEKDDPNYPKEWIYNKNGTPVCKEFVLIDQEIMIGYVVGGTNREDSDEER